MGGTGTGSGEKSSFPPTRAAVTGASGYLGGLVATRLVAGGWDVVGLGRRPVSQPGVTHADYRLGDRPGLASLTGVDVLIHCAWDFGQRSWKAVESINVQGTRLLFEAATEAGVPRIVHVSTVSASGVPRSMYGRAKLFTEAAALEMGGSVVRPGLLYGASPGGMVGMLTALVRALPIVPILVGADRPLFLAHEEDVTELIAMVADGSEWSPGAPLVAASRDPHSLREVLGAIAEAQDRRRTYVRVPWQAAYGPLRAAELLRVPLPMRSDSALSIATLDPDPFAWGYAPRSASFRPFEPSALRAGGAEGL